MTKCSALQKCTWKCCNLNKDLLKTISQMTLQRTDCMHLQILCMWIDFFFYLALTMLRKPGLPCYAYMTIDEDYQGIFGQWWYCECLLWQNWITPFISSWVCTADSFIDYNVINLVCSVTPLARSVDTLSDICFNIIRQHLWGFFVLSFNPLFIFYLIHFFICFNTFLN